MSILNSKIILAKGIKMDKAYNNVLDYDTSKMLELIRSATHYVASDDTYSFIRKNGRLSTGFSYSQCLKSNYIAFQNTDYDNKWFFAWIDTVEYKGEKCTEIEYTIDVWTTWYDNWTPTATMVLREHVSDDTIGANIQSENIPIGAYQTIQTSNAHISDSRYGIGFLVSDYPTGDAPLDFIANMQGGVFNGMSGGFYKGESDEETLDSAVSLINLYDDNNRKDAIQAIYAVPSIFFDTNDEMIENGIYTKYYSINRPTNNAVYKNIKNNKIFTYPYTKLVVSDNNGNNTELAFEYFEGDNATFTLKGRRNPIVELMLYPTGYKGDSKNYENQMYMSGFPTCAWATDYFKSWYHNNYQSLQNNLVANAVGNTLGAVGNIASGNVLGVAGNVTSMLNTVMQSANTINVAKMQPNIAKGSNSAGNINLCENNKKDFKFIVETLMNSELKRVDDYFTMFGYAINQIKVPAFNSRTNFNYIQIVGNIGYGVVPSAYMEIINKACNKGITIWHNHATFGDYSVTNSINS